MKPNPNADDVMRTLWDASRCDAAPAAAKARAAAKLGASFGVGSVSSIGATTLLVAAVGGVAAVAAGAWFVHRESEPRAHRAPVAEVTPDLAPPRVISPDLATPTSHGADLRREKTRPVAPSAMACESIALREERPTTCSVAGRPMQMEVVNGCASSAIDLYWVDYECKEVFYQRIDAGATFLQWTYDTHPWRIRRAGTGALLREVSASPPSAQWSDEPDRVVPIRAGVETAPGTTCSRNGSRIVLAFTNETSKPVDVFWVDDKCEEKPYGRLAAGARRVQKTFDAHPWRFRDSESGAFVDEYVPQPSTVQDDRVFVYVP